MKAKTLFLGIVCLGLGTANLHAHGDLHVQIQKISKRIEKKPTAELYLKRGELEREHREFDRALADYQKAAELDPAMDAIFLCRGKALLEAGQPAPARKSLDRFLERKPTHGDGYLTRARALAALKEYRSAAQDYTRSIEHTKEPRPEHFLERAEALEQAGELKEAVEGLDAGMDRLGKIPTLETAAIDIEVKQKRFDSALKRVDRLIREAQRKEAWQVLRADVLVKAGRKSEARQSYQDSLASIESLPSRLRTLQVMQDLEKKVRAALAKIPA